jgi:hypothetical protein
MTGALSAAASGKPAPPPNTISISNETISDFRLFPDSALAEYQLQSDGDIVRTISTAQADIGDWLSPKNNFGFYEARATVLGGDTPNGSLNTWNALSSTNAWSFFETEGNSTKSCDLLVEIRFAQTGVVLDSATISLSASVSGPI